MSSYKNSLHLPKTDMPINASLLSKEPSVYSKWYEENVYKRMQRDGKDPFVLHDGPPYANGDIHIGHALNKILKDFIVKFEYFKGRAIEFVPGWDCHGLPIEQKVKELESNPELFLDTCRKYAKSQIEIQINQFKSLGIIADWDNHYETMSFEFETMITNKLKELYDNGFLFQRKKPVYWSWKFKTALAEAEIDYREKVDESVYVAFKPNCVEHGAFLVWTTTPWTLPANVAVAINPTMKYCLAKSPHVSYPLCIAEECFDRLKKHGIVEERISEKTYTYEDFKDLKLIHPIYPDQTIPVIAADFVNSEKGTGFVHIAPGHGDEDYQLAIKNNLPIVMPVGPDGVYCEGKYKGLWIFEKGNSFNSNSIIFKDLKESDNFVCSEKISHSYPYCSRSDTPVIFRATNQWFLDLDKIRQTENNPLKCLEDVSFVPEVAKNRIIPMLKNRTDWCISRQRLWGVPIFNSNNVLDVWFDSGLTWNILKDKVADVFIEGNDQHRGWFQSSLWLSTAIQGKSPYKKVITHGFVVDKNGQKMSKSKGNVITPDDVIKNYGVEVLRYWVASSDYTKELQISQETLQRSSEGYKKFRNTLRFLVANMPELQVVNCELYPVDSWILQKSQVVFSQIKNLFENNLYYAAMQKLSEYINNDLSAIYLNSIKDRLYCGSNEERNPAILAMSKILKSLMILMAPLFTYTSQEVFGYLPNWMKDNAKDIFDLTFLDLDIVESQLEEYKLILPVFYSSFDSLKSEGIVRETLDVLLESDGPLFKGMEDFFVVSGVGPITNRSSLKEFICNGVNFKIVKSDLNKCQRCWKRNASDELCKRCQELVSVTN